MYFDMETAMTECFVLVGGPANDIKSDHSCCKKWWLVQKNKINLKSALNWSFRHWVERFSAQNGPGCIGKVHTGRENKYSQQYPQRNPISCMSRVQEGLELHFVSRQSHCEKLEAHFAAWRGNGAWSRAGTQGRSRGSPEQEVLKVPHIYPWLHHSHPSWVEAAGESIFFISLDVSLDLAAHHSMLPLSSPISPTLWPHTMKLSEWGNSLSWSIHSTLRDSRLKAGSI